MIVFTGSSPAFSARVRGMTSRALEKASIAICSLPPIPSAYDLRSRLSAAMTDPPPVRTEPSSWATATTPMASSNARLTSSITCSVPPLSRTETLFAWGHPSTKTMSESPIFLSSTLEALPRSSPDRSSRLFTILPPVAFERASMSLFLALLIANIPALAM